MRRVALSLLAFFLLAAPLIQSDRGVDETRTTLRAEVLRLINRERAARGLGTVELDQPTSDIADSYCRQQILNGTSGHFTIDGLTPYMRYSFAGGTDGLTENAAAWSANYNFSDRALYEMVRRSHDAMMAEQPPHDGHRQAILDPAATHVGIGLAWDGGEFRIAQEFVRRYLTWTRPLPRSAFLGDKITAGGKTLPGYRVDAVSIHYEPFPQPLTPRVANTLESYRLPERRRDLLPRLENKVSMRQDGTLEIVQQRYDNGSRGDFFASSEGNFSFDVPMNDGPGIYTVVVWVARKGDAAPTSASNISIRVDGPAARGTLPSATSR